MSSRRRKLLNYGLIAVTLLIVLIIGFSGQEMSGAGEAMRTIGPAWVVACLMAWAASVLCDALSTACFVLGEEKSRPILSEYGVSAIFLYADGTRSQIPAA